MPRRRSIRTTNQDKDLLRKLNKNVLNKKSRIRTNFGIEADFQTKSLKDFKSRKELNEYIEKAKSFTNRHNQNFQFVKNKHGAVFTKKEVNEVEREIKRINRIKDREAKKHESKMFKDRGKPTTLTVGQQRGLMGDVRYQEHQHIRFNIDRFRNRKEFQQYEEKLENQFGGDFMGRKKELYRHNYLRALENVFGDDSDHLKNIIMNMPLDKFMEFYYTENIADIGFIYDLHEARAKLEALERIFVA